MEKSYKEKPLRCMVFTTTGLSQLENGEEIDEV